MSQLREAGMYWSVDAHAWVTGATNECALPFFSQHPLRDKAYLSRIKGSLQHAQHPDATHNIYQGERNYRTEMDSSRDLEKFGRASNNSFNVAVTRARHEARVFTNSL